MYIQKQISGKHNIHLAWRARHEKTHTGYVIFWSKRADTGCRQGSVSKEAGSSPRQRRLASDMEQEEWTGVGGWFWGRGRGVWILWTGQNKKATGLSFLIFVFFSLFFYLPGGGLSFPFLRTNPDSLAWEVGVVFGCRYWNEITVAHVLFPGRRGIVMGAVQVMVFRFTTQSKDDNRAPRLSERVVKVGNGGPGTGVRLTGLRCWKGNTWEIRNWFFFFFFCGWEISLSLLYNPSSLRLRGFYYTS